jgi:hypothetical protein
MAKSERRRRELGWTRIFAGVFFVLVFAGQWVRAAELTPINFVSSGSGGIVEVIRFSQKQGFFKKQGLDMIMIYVPSTLVRISDSCNLFLPSERS